MRRQRTGPEVSTATLPCGRKPMQLCEIEASRASRFCGKIDAPGRRPPRRDQMVMRCACGSSPSTEAKEASHLD
jgi:hypothetical protein